MWNYSNISVETTLTGTVSAGDTAIPIASTAGLPVSFPYTVVLDYGAANAEVVTVTNLTGSTLTATRGQDGTTAQSHNLGAKVVHAVVARDLREPQQHIAASGDVHGIGGASNVVGTATVQTLTSKTISGAANTLTNLPASALVGTAKDLVAEASGVNAVPLTARAVNGQVADRARFENHLGVANTRVNAAGELVAGQLRTPGTLNVDGNLTATGNLSGANVNASAEVIVERASELDNAYRAAKTADTNARLLVRADGFHNWGPGNAAQDTNLYRSAANNLKTDDNFEVAGGTLLVGARNITGELDRLKRAPVAVFLASTGVTTTETTILTAQWNAVTGDNIRVAVSGQSTSNGADRQLTIRLKEDGVTIATRTIGSPTSNLSFPFQAERIRTGLSSGTKTYTVTAQMGTFTGNVTDAEISIIPVGG